MAVAQSSSGKVTKSRRVGVILGFSSLLTMHCTAQHLGLIQKRLNRSRYRLEWWVRLVRGTVCYVEGDDPWRGKGNFEGKHVPDKRNTPMDRKRNWSMQRRAHDGGRRLIAIVGRVYYRPCKWGGGGIHTAGEIWCLRLHCFSLWIMLFFTARRDLQFSFWWWRSEYIWEVVCVDEY